VAVAPSDPTDEDLPDPLESGRMTLVEHLAELRSRLVKSVVAVVLGGVVAFVFYPAIFDVLVDPYCAVSADGECRLLQTDPLEGFAVRMKIAGYGGLALAMPVILWQLWRFVTPGLYPKEKRYAIPFVASAVALFALGAGLAYWTLPKALGFLASIGGEELEQFYTPGKYLSLITYMMLAFGIGFEFPILLIFLQMAGIIESRTLRSWRRYAIVGIVVLVAVITPSGDPYSLAILSVPMYLFYEGSILVGWLIARRRPDG
jgi:sec-independent protein translocase protein TatC